MSPQDVAQIVRTELQRAQGGYSRAVPNNFLCQGPDRSFHNFMTTNELSPRPLSMLTQSKDEWVLDTAASKHVVKRKHAITVNNKVKMLTTAGLHEMDEGIGHTPFGPMDVLVGDHNILSIEQLLADGVVGTSLHWDGGGCAFSAHGMQHDVIVRSGVPRICAVVPAHDEGPHDEAHEVAPPVFYTEKERHILSHFPSDPTCRTCAIANGAQFRHARRRPENDDLPQYRDIGREPLELLHLDCLMVGSGANVAAVAVCADDHTGMLWLEAQKGPPTGALVVALLSRILRETPGRKIGRLRTDQGTEFTNALVENLCLAHGVVHVYSVPHESQTNGRAERAVQLTRALLARALLQAFGSAMEDAHVGLFEASLAPYLVSCVEAAYNRSAQVWHGRTPADRMHVAHRSFPVLLPFGAAVTFSVPSESQRAGTCAISAPGGPTTKLAPRGADGILIGYNHETSPPRCIVLAKDGKIFNTLNVKATMYGGKSVANVAFPLCVTTREFLEGAFGSPHAPVARRSPDGTAPRCSGCGLPIVDTRVSCIACNQRDRGKKASRGHLKTSACKRGRCSCDTSSLLVPDGDDSDDDEGDNPVGLPAPAGAQAFAEAWAEAGFDQDDPALDGALDGYVAATPVRPSVRGRGSPPGTHQHALPGSVDQYEADWTTTPISSPPRSMHESDFDTPPRFTPARSSGQPFTPARSGGQPSASSSASSSAVPRGQQPSASSSAAPSGGHPSAPSAIAAAPPAAPPPMWSHRGPEPVVRRSVRLAPVAEESHLTAEGEGDLLCMTEDAHVTAAALQEFRCEINSEFDKQVFKYGCYKMHEDGKLLRWHTQSELDAVASTGVEVLTVPARVHLARQGTETEAPRRKARIIIQGDRLRGTDSPKPLTTAQTPVWSHPASLVQVRFIIALGRALGMRLGAVDIEAAYLQAPLHPKGSTARQIFVKPNSTLRSELLRYTSDPAQFSADAVWLLLEKPVYGLPHSGHLFEAHRDGLYKELGWASVAPSVHAHRECQALSTSFVDDLLIASNTPQPFSKLPVPLATTSKAGWQHGTFEYLGMSVNDDAGTLDIDKGTLAVLAAYAPYVGPAVKLPPTRKQTTPSDPFVPEQLIPALLGSLLWLARTTRPDLSRPVSELASERDALSQGQLGRRILGYLKAHPRAKLSLMSKQYADRVVEFRIRAACDASHGSEPGSRSRTGVNIFLDMLDAQGQVLCSQLVDWSSRCQGCVSVSTAEAELIGISTVTREATGLLVLLRSLLDVVRPALRSSLLILNDNSPAIMAIGRGTSDAMGHISRTSGLRLMSLHETLTQNVDIRLQHCPTAELSADLHTKMVPAEVVARHLRTMGLVFATL